MEASGAGLHAARWLLRVLRRLEQGPSPLSRLPPGYLRNFTAEAAPAAAEEAASSATATALDAAATTAAAGGRAAAAPKTRAPRKPKAAPEKVEESRLPSFGALTELAKVLEQAAGKQAVRHSSMSPALRAMTWHERHMDMETPAGRELRRNWQRQIILETKALDATRARWEAAWHGLLPL